MSSMKMLTRTSLVLAALAALLVLMPATASALQGPYAQFVTMSDGLGIDIDLRWPDGDPPENGWPAIILAHSRRGHKGHLAEAGEHYANRGYVTLAYSCRGDGASKEGGRASDTTAATRGRDVADLRAWLVSGMPDSVRPHRVRVNPERVGMTGASQGALNSWYGALADGQLAAIVPQVFALHTWERGFVSNGSVVFRLQRMKMAHPILATYNVEALGALTRADSVAHRIPSLLTPVLTQAAMLDIWAPVNDAIRDYQAASAGGARMIYIGTGGHCTPSTDDTYRDGYLRDAWFDYHLKGERNGVRDMSRIHVALLDTLEKVTFDTFPHPEEKRIELFLAADGKLQRERPGTEIGSDVFVNNPGDYTLAQAAADGFEQDSITARLAQDSVHYQTAPLSGEAVILGMPTVRLFVSGTASTKYQVNIHLTDNAPDAPRRLLAWGTCLVDRAANPDGAIIEAELSYTGRRVLKGHRVGLTVTNLDLEILTPGGDPILRHLPYLEHSENTVYHTATKPSAITVALIEGALP